MLELTIQGRDDLWDEKNQRFVQIKTTRITLEHSLISISKWEAIWHKSFLSDITKDNPLTAEELASYIRCMLITQSVPDDTLLGLTREDFAKIQAYIDDPMTATVFYDPYSKPGKKKKERVTSELIYYWMISLGIPYQFQQWHLNRLMTLIQVCNEENKKHDPNQKGPSKRQIADHYSEVNERRWKELEAKKKAKTNCSQIMNSVKNGGKLK